MVLIYIFPCINIYIYILFLFFIYILIVLISFALTRKLLNLFKWVFVTVLNNYQSLISQPQQYSYYVTMVYAKFKKKFVVIFTSIMPLEIYF